MTNKPKYRDDTFIDLLAKHEHLIRERQVMFRVAAEHVMAGRLTPLDVRDALALTPYAYKRNVVPWFDHLLQGNGVGQ